MLPPLNKLLQFHVEATETEEFTNPEDNGTEAKEDITSITDESEGQAAQKD